MTEKALLQKMAWFEFDLPLTKIKPGYNVKYLIDQADAV